MSLFFDLPIKTQVQLAQDQYFKYYGVSVPVVTSESKAGLLRAKADIDAAFSAIRAKTWTGPLSASTGFQSPGGGSGNITIPLSPEMRAFLPPGYTDTQVRIYALDGMLSDLQDSVAAVIRNQNQLPPTGANVTFTPTTPVVAPIIKPVTAAPVASSQSNNTLSTVLGVGAAALGAIALVKAFTPQTAPAEVAPASDPAVNQDIPVDNEDIPIDQAQAEDFGGTDEAMAEQERIQSFEPAPTDEEVQAADVAMEEAIQAQQDADQDYASSTGYNSIEELRAAQDQQALDQIAEEAANSGPQGITQAEAETAGAPTRQDTITPKGDWRVRLSLAPGSNYLYKAKNAEGILLPLLATDGVIFPYTPNIIVSYAAHYDPAELTHSNYKIFQYKNSSVDTITITCEFTAQDTAEANYLLAVIHFFKSVTKMFYGKDENPMRGTPPPLCYLTGLGQFQFDQHPLAITTFNYTLPTDVDYVRANSTGTSVAGGATPTGGDGGYPDASKQRQLAAALQAGGGPAPPNFNFTAATNTQATYVPTKMQISITAVPIVSRGDISKEFSLKKYATGALLQGSKRQGGGIW